jgi:2,3-bisphosphoglycerate-dependent phosphoglycerate mutase
MVSRLGTWKTSSRAGPMYRYRRMALRKRMRPAKLLKKDGYTFDVAYSSVLQRANKTEDYVLQELGETKIPHFYSWRLNERHYGALQGLNKADSAKKWGDEQVHIWRRSADVQPPALTYDDPRWPGNQEKYQKLGLTKEEMPLPSASLIPRTG